MEKHLDLADIQGNVIKAYGRWGFPKSRYIFYRIHDGKAGRSVVTKLLRFITNSVPWFSGNPIPEVTTNIAFTYEGLKQLGLPESTLHGFPNEFSQGMKARRDILGDTGVNAPEKWDRIWNLDDSPQVTHMLIWINGNALDENRRPIPRDAIVGRIEKRYQEIQKIVEASGGGVEQLTGHKGDDGDDMPYQEGSAVYKNEIPQPTEHFGYTDGISDPYFRGMGGLATDVIGAGKPTGGDPATIEGWEPIETGEFLLGHKDEAFEYPQAPLPSLLARNGTFTVYRKLHQNVATFNEYCERMGKIYGELTNKPVNEAREELEAKFVGRWKNGAPLATFPTKAAADKFAAELKTAQEEARTTENKDARARYAQLKVQLRGFDFNSDLHGKGCPIGAHIRRVNPRGSLEFGVTGAYETPGALTNRRRIIRRGLPYGEVKDPSHDNGNHGIIIMILNASIKRQFEFVQQQWINFGNDFKLSNDQDPILGNHGEPNDPQGRMIIQNDPQGDKPPFFCDKVPTFVETRGGDYFFIPSITAIRMIGDGVVDPT